MCGCGPRNALQLSRPGAREVALASPRTERGERRGLKATRILSELGQTHGVLARPHVFRKRSYFRQHAWMHACNECMQRIHPASASPGILHNRARTSRSNFIAGQLAPPCPPLRLSCSSPETQRNGETVVRARVCVCVCVCARARDQLLWMNPCQDIVLARSSSWRRSGTGPFAATWVSSMVVVRGETADNDAGTDAKIGNRCSRRRVELILSTRAPQNPAEPTDPR